MINETVGSAGAVRRALKRLMELRRSPNPDPAEIALALAAYAAARRWHDAFAFYRAYGEFPTSYNRTCDETEDE